MRLHRQRLVDVGGRLGEVLLRRHDRDLDDLARQRPVDEHDATVGVEEPVHAGGVGVEAVVQTPGGLVNYEGSAAIDGVPGTAAPVFLNFMDVVGSVCGSLLPTGRLRA